MLIANCLDNIKQHEVCSRTFLEFVVRNLPVITTNNLGAVHINIHFIYYTPLAYDAELIPMAQKHFENN